MTIPPLINFQPQQTAKALWDIFQGYDFEIMEEVAGINIAQHMKEEKPKVERAGDGSHERGQEIFL